MDEKGFSLIEIMVVIAVIAILASVAIPAISSWLPNYTLKSETRDVYGVMSKAKSTAVKGNTRAVIIFNLANDTYTAFLDNNPATWSLDASETILGSGTMGDGIDIYNCTIPYFTYGFNGRGLPDEDIATGTYEVHLRNSKGQYMGVRVNSVGCLSIITSTDGGTTWN